MNDRINDAVHEICILAMDYLDNSDAESQEIGDGLSDIAEALAFNNLELLRRRMERLGTEVRNCIPIDSFELIVDLGGYDSSSTLL